MNHLNKKKIVNGFTIFRIIGIPFLFLFRGWKLLLLVNLMFISDYFDGYFARKWKVVSTKGAILDLLADKLLVIVILTIAVLNQSIGIILWALIVFREVYSMVIRFQTMAKGRELIAASMVGKAKTALQFISIDFLILEIPSYKFLLWCVVILSYYSFATYFKKSKEV